MKINIAFHKSFLDRLKHTTKAAEVNDLIIWPECKIVFSDEKTNQIIKFEPDVALSWLDNFMGALEHPNTKLPKDIWGLPLEIIFSAGILTITDRETKQELFKVNISTEKLLSMLISEIKMAQHTIEMANPLVRNDQDWSNHYFVSHYN